MNNNPAPVTTSDAERAAFEAHYAKIWKERTHKRESLEELRAVLVTMRDDAGYNNGAGEHPAFINNLWEGWQARSALPIDFKQATDQGGWQSATEMDAFYAPESAAFVLRDMLADASIEQHLPQSLFLRAQVALGSKEPNLHPATADLVRRFSKALTDKLSAAEKKYGYSNGWLRNDWMDECRAQLLEHIAKGDPRDVAAYCAFLWHHGEKTGTARELDPEVFLDSGLADVQDEGGINTYYSKAAVLECIAYALAAAPTLQGVADGDAVGGKSGGA